MPSPDDASAGARSSVARPLDREWSDDRELDLFAGVMFLWRHKYLLIAALVVGVLVALLWWRLQPSRFDGLATVVLQAPRALNPLAPPTLTIEVLDGLAAADVVRGHVDAVLRQQGRVDGNRRVLALQTVRYSSTSPEQPFLPMLGLKATATTPELARDASNAWASALIEQASKLRSESRASTVDYVLAEYPKAAQRLTEEERRLQQLRHQHARALQDVRSNTALSLREEQLWAREHLLVKLEEDRHLLRVELRELDATIVQLERERGALGQVKGTAQLQSPPDDTVRADLERQLVEMRVRRSALAVRQPAIEELIEKTRQEAAAARAAVGAGILSVDVLEGQQRIEVMVKERELEVLRAQFKKLESQIGDARLMREESAPALSLGSPAEIPLTTSRPDLGPAMLIGAAGALILALAAAWLLDRVRLAHADANVRPLDGRP